MFIRSIHLINYRCHINSKIDFFKDRDNGQISIIEGGDGQGKTCIFNAIGWCLYGKETSKLLGIEPPDSVIQNKGLSIKETPEELSVELSIGLESKTDNSPRSIIIRRWADFRGNEISAGEFLVDRYYDVGPAPPLRGDAAQRYIDDIIPQDLVEFYMFNGEYLISGKNVKGGNIDSSIKSQFKIGAMKSMMKLLENMEEGYRKSADKAVGSSANEIGTKIDENNGYIKKFTLEKDKYEEDCINYSEGKEKAKTRLKELENTISEIKGRQSAIKMFISKNEQLERTTNNLNKEYVDLHKTQYAYSYLALSKGTNEESYNSLKGEIKRANLPPNIKEDFVKDLLAQHKCICGSSLPEGSDGYKNIEDMLLSIKNESRKNILLDLAEQIRRIAKDLPDAANNKIKDIDEHINSFIQDKTAISDELSTWQSKEKGLSEEENNKIEEYGIIEENMQHFEEYLKDAKENLENAKEKIEKFENDNKKLKEIEEKIAAKVVDGRKFNGYKNVCIELDGIISQLIEKVTFMFIENLQNEVNDLISRVSGLSHISTDIKLEWNSIQIKYINKYINSDDPIYLSEGQMQIISITLIAAYMSVLKRLGAGIIEAPFVVMDHPFSNLGFPRKKELLKSFSSIFKDTNIIILTPPGDFNLDPVAEIIASHYEVHNNEKESACYVKEAGI